MLKPLTRQRFAHLSSLLAALLLATTLSAQTTYHWTDQKTGVTAISDLPPPPGTPGVTVSEDGKPPGDEQQLPYATRQASAKFPVVLYTSAACSVCQQARALLNGRGVPFSETLLSSQKELTALGQRLGGDAVLPSISVGRQHSTGFAAATWNELLDFAGYPARAPYGFKPSAPAAQ